LQLFWFGDIYVDNFLIEVDYDPVSGSYMACYANGQNILLGGNTYQDAVLEADLINPEEYAND
jgi:hypothetical protein